MAYVLSERWDYEARATVLCNLRAKVKIKNNGVKICPSIERNYKYRYRVARIVVNGNGNNIHRQLHCFKHFSSSHDYTVESERFDCV